MTSLFSSYIYKIFIRYKIAIKISNIKICNIDKKAFLKQYIDMSRMIKIFIIFIFFSANVIPPAFPEDFTDAALETTPKTEEEELMFAPVELDLSSYEENTPSKNKKINLRIEKTEKPSQIKTTNRIWDGSKIYHYQYYGDKRNLNPISATGVLGEKLETNLDENTKVIVGQDGMDSYNGYTLNFIYNNGSVYNTGAKILGNEDNFDYSIGAYTQTASLENSYGGVISTKPAHILNSKGTFSFGSGVYTNLNNNDTKNTTGLFSQYNLGRFSLGSQISQSAYANSSSATNSVHLLPAFKINNHLSLTGKLVKNMTTDETQQELGLRYAPFSDDSVIFDITGTTYRDASTFTRQRLKFSTSFRL